MSYMHNNYAYSPGGYPGGLGDVAPDVAAVHPQSPLACAGAAARLGPGRCVNRQWVLDTRPTDMTAEVNAARRAAGGGISLDTFLSPLERLGSVASNLGVNVGALIPGQRQPYYGDGGVGLGAYMPVVLLVGGGVATLWFLSRVMGGGGGKRSNPKLRLPFVGAVGIVPLAVAGAGAAYLWAYHRPWSYVKGSPQYAARVGSMRIAGAPSIASINMPPGGAGIFVTPGNAPGQVYGARPAPAGV